MVNLMLALHAAAAIVSVMCAAGEGVVYKSPELQTLVDRARLNLNSEKTEDAMKSIDLFADLKRTDLLLDALSLSNYDVAAYAAQSLKKACSPPSDLASVLIAFLSKPDVFPPEKGGERAAIQMGFAKEIEQLVSVALSAKGKQPPPDLDVRKSDSRYRIIKEMEPRNP